MPKNHLFYNLKMATVPPFLQTAIAIYLCESSWKCENRMKMSMSQLNTGQQFIMTINLMHQHRSIVAFLNTPLVKWALYCALRVPVQIFSTF